MDRSNYGPLERLLHALALNRVTAAASFDLEQSLVRPDPDGVHAGRHVFIAGLARAGSSALLEALHRTGMFRTLTYSDMPFVLMPNTWRKLSASHRRSTMLAERAHGDGIAINVDSPEALEEVFWRVFSGRTYIKADRLVPHEVTEEDLDRFRRFVAAVLASGAPNALYLSKNNNNLLRLGSFKRAFPNCVLVVPFRDPVQHAMSLLNQHRRFKERHRADGFSRQYMSWLAHHEFGLTHKPFIFEPAEAQVLSALDQDHPNYWLALWIHAYGHLMKTAPSDAMWVEFEDFCSAPREPIAQVLKRCERSAKLELQPGFVPTVHAPPSHIRSDLLRAAQGLHGHLHDRALRSREAVSGLPERPAAAAQLD